MGTGRRDWLKQAGLLVAGAGLLPLRGYSLEDDAFFEEQPINQPLRLCYNENPYGPPAGALKAMIERATSANLYHFDEVRDAIDKVARKNGVGKENILLGAGSTQMLDTVVQLAAMQKGNIVVPDPSFTHWTRAAGNSGLQTVAVPLTQDRKIDLPALLKAIKNDTRMVYICNPNNPTGTLSAHDDLLSFVKEATARTMVLVDEAYLDYTTEPSMAALAATNPKLIVVKTFSKIYGMAGARAGYAIGHGDTIKKMTEMKGGSNLAISAMTIAGIAAALTDAAFTKKSYELNAAARAFTIAGLDKLNAKCIPSHTNFIYFSLADYKGDYFKKLETNRIKGTGVFEEQGKWTRISVGTMEQMRRFLDAIA